MYFPAPVWEAWGQFTRTQRLWQLAQYSASQRMVKTAFLSWRSHAQLQRLR